LNYKEINRFITDNHKAPALDRAFGGAEWKDCIPLPEEQRRTKLLDLYKAALKTRGGAEFVSSFLMHDSNDRPLYWLIFGTNNIRGLHEMKRAMWSVDSSGSFRFSDREVPGQLKLLNDAFDQRWLADELERRLIGKSMNVEAVYRFVLTQTPCFQFNEALKQMENDGRVRVTDAPPERRQGTFGTEREKREKIVVQFQRKKPTQKDLFGD
jgi:hypothetical protein